MLPVELYKLIIDILRDDTDTLKACSLTCKTFLHLSRYHLFYNIRLYGGDHTERFLDIIGSVHSSTSPCTYVRYLTLSHHGWMNKALPLLIPHLLNVTNLELHFKWNGLDDTQRVMMLSAFQKVTYLDLYYCWFNTSVQMNELIASFPLLEHLRCSSNWSKYAEPTIPLPQGINKITMPTYHLTFFDQLLSLEPHPNVRAIAFSGLDGRFMEEANKLLKTLGSHLEDLQVGKISSQIVSRFSAVGQ
jgi:hypothetical protein